MTNLESPHIFFRNAKQFYAIASYSFEALNGDNWKTRGEILAESPIHFNLCMAIELALKSFILFETKRFRAIHDLEELFENAGLDKSNFLYRDITNLQLLSLYHRIKQKDKFSELSGRLRYGAEGHFSLPCFYETCDFIIRLFEEITTKTNGKMIEPHRQRYNERIITDKEKLKKRFEYLASPLSSNFEYDYYLKFKGNQELVEICDRLTLEEEYIPKPNAHLE